MDETTTYDRLPITWDRAAAIFGNAKQPKEVWQKQFDCCDDDLQRIARTPYEEFDFSDLWYYHHDLAYVDLQPDLFAYLFPVCLMDWHLTLLRNEPCFHGDSEFHYGVHRGDVFHKLTTAEQQEAMFHFMRDSFLERIDTEQRVKKAHGWIGRLNSLGLIMPRIDLLWNSWWNLETRGQTIAALQYCSGLMHFDGENPLFPMWTPQLGGGGPYLWENDSHIFDAGWRKENVEFISSVLTVEYVEKKLTEASVNLEGQPEGEIAEKMRTELPLRNELLQERVQELPKLLAKPQSEGWTI